MQCIKTGCVAYLTNYHEYVIGDAFIINDVLLIRTTYRGRDNPRGYVNFNIHDIEQWWEDEPVGTLLSRGYAIKGLE